MERRTANPARLYLPLLADAQPNIRHHAAAILLGTYGDRALTFLRQLLDDPDRTTRQRARAALRILGEDLGVAIGLHPPPRMYVECLGQLRVYIAGHEIHPHDWAQLDGGRAGWRKVQGVFAYLIHCGRRGSSRESLGAAVWGGPVSASSLSRTLTALRQALDQAGDAAFVERALTITRDSCVLSPEAYHTDVQLFGQAFNIACAVEQTRGLAAAVPLYAQAVNLYGGPYMAGVPGGETWSQARHDLHMNEYLIAAERLAEHAYTRRRYQHCAALCRAALQIDPAADDITAWLLRTYNQVGLYDELGRAYREYLRRVAIDPASAEARQDLVVQTYQGFTRERAVGA